MKSFKKTIISILVAIMFVIPSISFTSEAASGTWKQSGGRWWYQYSDGSYARSEYIDGYWLDSAGWYDSAWNGSWKSNSKGWWFQSGSWYPTNQWLKIDKKWYYFKSSGYMASSEWIGNYYLASSGAMATNTWIGDYYVGSDGAWVKGKTKNTGGSSSGSTSTGGNSGSNSGSSSSGGSSASTDASICSYGGTHTWAVFETAHTVKIVKYDSNGSMVIHSFCNKCGADMTEIQNTKPWKTEDFGYSQDVWDELGVIAAARTWHQLKTGCNGGGSTTERTVLVDTTIPTCYKCTKCAIKKEASLTETCYYRLQNNLWTESEYIIHY